MTLTEAAKAIRGELKTAFPATKFRVRTKRYAGGCSITVSWVNGPTDKEVAAFTWKYKNGNFDGMIDCYEYANDGRPGGADYVFCEREYSPEAKATALQTLAAYWGDWTRVDEYERQTRVYRHLTATALA